MAICSRLCIVAKRYYRAVLYIVSPMFCGIPGSEGLTNSAISTARCWVLIRICTLMLDPRLRTKLRHTVSVTVSLSVLTTWFLSYSFPPCFLFSLCVELQFWRQRDFTVRYFWGGISNICRSAFRNAFRSVPSVSSLDRHRRCYKVFKRYSSATFPPLRLRPIPSSAAAGVAAASRSTDPVAHHRHTLCRRANS